MRSADPSCGRIGAVFDRLHLEVTVVKRLCETVLERPRPVNGRPPTGGIAAGNVQIQQAGGPQGDRRHRPADCADPLALAAGRPDPVARIGAFVPRSADAGGPGCSRARTGALVGPVLRNRSRPSALVSRPTAPARPARGGPTHAIYTDRMSHCGPPFRAWTRVHKNREA